MSKQREIAEMVEPNPADLVESLRNVGYTLSTAIADLINYSITAGKREIRVLIEPSQPCPHVFVIDDACGMSAERLIEAMKMGTCGPLSERSGTDLGRLWLGLKTASLSIGRGLTAVTKRLWDTFLTTDPVAVSGRRHGCLLHQHSNCQFAHSPEARRAFWPARLRDRQGRNARIRKDLEEAAWHAIVMRERKLPKPAEVSRRLQSLLFRLDRNRNKER